jgi:hypothetical protein
MNATVDDFIEKSEEEINPFRHQKQFCMSPWAYPQVEDFFLIGGYGCGKSFSIVLLTLTIVNQYRGYEVSVGLGSVTISLFRKTVWVDLERILKMSGSEYSFDKQANTIRIETITFQIVPMENPGDIYAYNFSIFIGDEIDELPQDKSIAVHVACHERTRVVLPDGRVPFVCFATTAQGFKGCYQITQELRKKKTPYIVIRGHTKDNTSLSKRYVETLYNLYNENERKAYLEGQFINLSTGRVYPDYDQSKNMCPRFEVKPEDVIHIGQDMNTGFSKAVAYIKRQSRGMVCLYAHQTFSFKSISDAPRLLRMAYPQNEILWYPDVNAQEVILAFSRELREFNIQMRLSNQNPSVIERIFIANKVFRSHRCYIMDGQLKDLVEGCNAGNTEELDMALKVRQYDELGNPMKGRGEKSPDHVADANEYVLYRLVSSDSSFLDIWEAAKKMNQAQKIRINTLQGV